MPARLGILGGTFDPLHLGHLVAASEAMHAFSLDRVVFVPAGQPWQRSEFTPAEDRYLMTVLGTGGHPDFAVSRLEIDRRGPTYTADTLEVLSETHPGAALMFIAGADAVMGLGSWKGIERVAELAEVIAVTRSDFDLGSLETSPDWPEIHVLEMPAIGISATEVRERVRTQRPIDYLVPDEVRRYIRERSLYQGD